MAKTIIVLVEECYLDEAVRLDLQPSSLKGYRWYCRSFAKWLGAEFTVDQIDEKTRPTYLTYLEATKAQGGRGYRPRLVRCIHQAIQYFYTWLVERKHMAAIPDDRGSIKLPGLDKVTRRSCKPTEARAVIQACQQVERPYRQVLLCAMITMFHDIPVRRMELLDLELRDIDLATHEVQIRHGKGDKARTNYLSDDGVAAVRAYLAVRPKTALPNLWVHNRTEHVGRDWIYDQIKMLAEIAGIDYKNVLPHACRRGTARRFREEGKVDLEVLRHMLGHSSLAVTQLYIASDDEELAKNRNAARLFFADAASPAQPSVPVQPPSPPETVVLPLRHPEMPIGPFQPILRSHPANRGTRPRALRRPVC